MKISKALFCFFLGGGQNKRKVFEQIEKIENILQIKTKIKNLQIKISDDISIITFV